MQLRNKIVNLDNTGFVKGIRVGNVSVKIYYSKENQYLVVRRKYFLGFCYSTKEVIVNDYYTAEDYLSNLEFDVHKIV